MSTTVNLVKAFLEKPNGTVEVRRVPLDSGSKNSITFDLLKEKIASAFLTLADSSFNMTWKDEDDDFITMSSNEELREALETLTERVLKVYIVVQQDEEPVETCKKTTEEEAAEREQQQEIDPAAPPNRQEKGFLRGHRMGFRGAFRGGRMGGPFSRTGGPRIRFGAPGSRIGGPSGLVGGPNGRMGGLFGHRGGPSGLVGGANGRMGGLGGRVDRLILRLSRPCRPTHPELTRAGCPFVFLLGPAGSRLSEKTTFNGCGRFNGRCGMRKPSLEERRPFGLLGQHPFRRGCAFKSTESPGMLVCPMKKGMMGRPLSSPIREMRGPCPDRGGPEMKAWRINLRETVPVLHRRWAKAYIQQWREQNLDNATSTSSDEGTSKRITAEEANVPASYANWLDVVLPRIHKRWSGEATGNFKDDLKEQLKDEVPGDFRKWCRMYLNRRFAPMTPRFMPGPRSLQEMRQSTLPDPQEEQLGEFPSQKHRTFTKAFIKQWHQEHALTERSLLEDSSESNEQEPQTVSSDIVIPADYTQWLNAVLPLLYNKCGVSVNEPEPSRQELKEKLAQFKDTVPLRYRKWVKFYVRKILNGGKMVPVFVGNPFRQMPSFMKMQVLKMGKPGMRGTSESEATEKYLPQSKPDAESQSTECASAQNNTEQSTGDTAQTSLEQSSGESGDEEMEIPPHVLAWMRRSMNREQLGRMKFQIKEQKDGACRGRKTARECARPTRKVFQFRYV